MTPIILGEGGCAKEVVCIHFGISKVTPYASLKDTWKIVTQNKSAIQVRY